VLTALSSSCSEAISTLDRTQYIQNLIAVAASRSITLTVDQITVTIQGCSASTRRRLQSGSFEVILLVEIEGVSGQESTQVSASD
jgi:hypothetical protein